MADSEESVYDILSRITNLKFKAQISDCGITFERIYNMTDLRTNQDFYLLILNDTSIRFDDTSEFIKRFILYLQKSLEGLNEEYKDLRKREREEVFVDENEIFMLDETVGLHGGKQLKLIERMRKLQAKL